MTTGTNTTEHVPVLVNEVIDGLAIAPEDIVFDGTLGGGGHARAILEIINEKGQYIGLDQDIQAIERNKEALAEYSANTILIHDNFANVNELWLANGLPRATKVLLDLGWNSDQFKDAERGFSFQLEGPLDMRLDNCPNGKLTAHDLVNTLEKDQLADIIANYGEERYAKRIAREIVYYRQEFGPIENTLQLVNIIKEAVPASYTRTRIHPATRTFQALRIAVNDELGVLRRGLEGLLGITDKEARIAVISFHSLEDRIVKHMFRHWHEVGHGKIITKKPIAAGHQETTMNPRSRSAKLRIFHKKQ